jgi:methanogenic corrinoid protein MtbC1
MKENLLYKLQQAIREYDAENAEALTKQTVAENIDPLETLDVLTKTIRTIGEKFEKNEIFLPELIGAAEAMTSSTNILEEEIKRQGKKKQDVGTIVIGTVFGDIHDIGKNIVATLLRAAGYSIYDRGVNVKASSFIEAIGSEKPDILALSALLTTTAPEQERVVQTLIDKGDRAAIKIIVGGGGVTEEFAQDIGADGYAATAAGAVNLVQKLLS